nr:YHS domain-containing (seleno)protein [Phaeobacter sp. HF9A]
MAARSAARLCVAVALLTLATGMRAEAGTLYISAEDGVAIGGYDPVSFFVAEGPTRGERSHAVMWKGAIWLFHSAEHRSRFESNPRAYAPRYGGHCAYGIAKGRIYHGDPQAWEIVDGRLYLFHNPRAEELWMAQQQGMIEAAREVWPQIMRQR